MNYRKNTPTIYDVAARAGVSPATVSRVFANTSYPVSKATREKVLDAADFVKYAPMLKAKKNSGKNVAVVIPNLDNPYYSSLAAGLEHSLRLSEMATLLINTNGILDIEKALIADLAVRDVCGMIIVPCSDACGHIRDIANKHIPVVIMEQDEQQGCSSVSFNYRAGGAMAVQYLRERGCKSIGFIGSPLTRHSRRTLHEGYLSALSAQNLDDRYVRIAENENRADETNYSFEYKNAVEQVDYMIENRCLPQAIFCVNDITAICVIQLLRQKGYDVPGDVSVMGFDNIQMSEVIYPALTTIDQCIYEMGNVAADLLASRVNSINRKDISVTLQPKLVVRNSVV